MKKVHTMMVTGEGSFSRRRFTLIELLVVVGIIAVLAGLILPAVIGGQERGRIASAKSDMATLTLALKQLETTYGKFANKSGSTYSFNGKNAGYSDGDSFIRVSGGERDAYNAFIAELSDPANGGLSSLNINKRKIRFLDPRGDYDPTMNYDAADNLNKLWLDPWGNPYVIMLNIDGSNEIAVPAAKAGVDDINLATSIAIYSCGPNGEDDGGRNQENGGDDFTDDITGW